MTRKGRSGVLVSGILWALAMGFVQWSCGDSGTSAADGQGEEKDRNGTDDLADGATEDVPGLNEAKGDDVAEDLWSRPEGDPAMAGPHEFDEIDTGITIDELGTILKLDVAVPKEQGKHPVIVFTHGFALNSTFYQTYKKHLASWGYVVILPTMPGTAFKPKTHDELASYVMMILDWVEEEADNPDGPFGGRADASLMGLSGHSMGGKISLLVASQDDRVDASFTVDPVDSTPPTDDPSGFPSVTPEKMGSILIPLAFAGETLDGEPMKGSTMACAPAADNFEQFFMHAVGKAIKLDFPGANHMSFLDDANCGLLCAVCQSPTADPALVRDHTIKYMTAFYNVNLKGQIDFDWYLYGPGMKADEDKGVVMARGK